MRKTLPCASQSSGLAGSAPNEAADQLAKEATRKNPSGLTNANNLIAKYQAMGEQNKIVFNVTKYLRQEEQQNYRDTLDNETNWKKEPRYKYLRQKGIDWHRSAYLGKVVNRTANAIQKYAHKNRRQLLLDKESMYARRDQVFWKQKRHKGRDVQDRYCDLCRNLPDGPQIETRDHHLYCQDKKMKDERARIKTRILATINGKLSEHIQDIPCYWNQDEKHEEPQDGLWTEIETYTPYDAACALIPQAWVKYLKALPWKEKDILESVIAQCQYIIVEHLHKCWVTRCKDFYKKHPKT